MEKPAEVEDPTGSNIFLSHSGPASLRLATALRSWLPAVNNYFQPWVSEKDIESGERWQRKLDEQLGSNRLAILCLTPENLDARWILFEAGALSNAVGKERVCPYLLGLTKAEVRPPISQFQMRLADQEDTGRLVSSLNRALGKPLSDEIQTRSFAKWWPDLNEEIKKIDVRRPSSIKRRSDRELLEEILGAVRSTNYRINSIRSPLKDRFPLQREHVVPRSLIDQVLEKVQQRAAEARESGRTVVVPKGAASEVVEEPSVEIDDFGGPERDET